MFTRLYNSIREAITRGPNHTANSDSKNSEYPSGEYIDSIRRRPSVTEELQNNDTHSMFANNHTTTGGLNRSNSVALTEPIPINENATRRRSSTIFNISNITADDYVQKDLISSSWS